MCDNPRCKSKDEDLRYIGHWICWDCWRKYGEDKLDLKKVFKIKPKKDKELLEYAVWRG